MHHSSLGVIFWIFFKYLYFIIVIVGYHFNCTELCRAVPEMELPTGESLPESRLR